MKKSCKKEAVADSFLIFIVIGFCLVGLFDIYVHIKWWISWPTFFVTFGTFCSFAVLTFFSGFILHFPIKRRRLIDDDAQLLIILAESVFTGSISIPLRYLCAYNPGLPHFWGIVMPVVGIGFPLLLNIALYKSCLAASIKDKESDTQVLDEWRRKWEPFLLGSEGCEKFKRLVECRRREINMKYAEYGCMRQILPSRVSFLLVDTFVEKFGDILAGKFWWNGEVYRNEYSISSDNEELYCIKRGWNFNVGKPSSSFAIFDTELYFNGYLYVAAIKILVTGECALCMRKYSCGDEGSETEFKSWDEMLKYLDKKLGIES